MIAHDVLQGSDEWKQLRLGIPTASRFDEILTPKTRKFSAASRRYIWELVAEEIMGQPIESTTSMAMERGWALEVEARNWYSFDHDTPVDEVGFCTNDAGTIGASPDGLIGTDGGLEIKCPGALKHMDNLFGADIARYGQVQGGIWICERDYWDVTSYHPKLPPVVVRVYRDDDYIADLEAAMRQFLDELEKAREYVRTLGEAGRREIINPEVKYERS